MTRCLLLCLALLAAAPAALMAQTRDEEEALVRATIRGVVEEARHPFLRWPDFPDYRDELQAFYEPLDYQLAWFTGGRMNPQTRVAVDELLEADRQGLHPEDYDAVRLDSLRHGFESDPDPPPDVRALFDVALTIGLFRYLSDVQSGRVDPANLNIGFKIERTRSDLPAQVRAAVAEGRIPELIEEAQPQLLEYRLLVQALARYRELAGATEQPVLPQPSSDVQPGQRYAGLPQLRQLLIAVGDLSGSEGGPVSLLYEGEIVEAVKRFQMRHGRTVDGVLGPATLASLGVPLSKRVEQIELALERLRWLPPLDTTRFIAVNLPAFRLWALDPLRQEQRPVLSMRVVVGKALHKQTPVFMEKMRWLEFRPYWNVPYGITVREILPLAREDTAYLSRNGYEIVPHFGGAVQPVPATEASLEQLGSGQLKLRQRPGPNNSLGLVKFILPNSADVYLHATPATQFFERSRRDFSHGCIRVEDPVALAEFVLADEPGGWTRERIVAAMDGARSSRVVLTRPIPVVIFYTTALASAAGTVSFYDDLYGHDRMLAAALAAGYPYPP